METRKDLDALIGKRGFLKIPECPEIGFTYLGGTSCRISSRSRPSRLLEGCEPMHF